MLYLFYIQSTTRERRIHIKQYYYYQYYLLNSPQDYIDLYNEIQSYVKNEYEESFDFGEGEMFMEQLHGSEDGYYEMDLDGLKPYLYDCLSNNYYIYDDQHDYFKCDLDYWMQNLPKNNKYPEHKSFYAKRYKNHLKQLTIETSMSAGWFDYEWDEFYTHSTGIGYLKRYYAPRRAKYLRKLGNKKVRQYRKGLSNGGNYRKVFDF